MKLIVGLGNPGQQYAQTRHNVGFMALERLAGRHGLGAPKARFQGMATDGLVVGDRCLLLWPMTYMNRSGQSVRAALDFYKLSPTDDVLVVVDDVALPCGTIRLRAGGSAGGHNGLTDVQRALGTQGYARLRIGVDPPGRIPQADYVLGKFRADQWEQVDPAIDRACDAIECWLGEGIDAAMTRYNAR